MHIISKSKPRKIKACCFLPIGHIAAVAGTQVFGAVAASSKRFEHLAAACCATGGLAFAFLATQPAGLGAALAPFLAFQLALGAAKPCLAALRGKHVAPDQRDVAARAQAACATIASVVGALLASTASLAAAGPAKASQRKLTGYVMDDGSI